VRSARRTKTVKPLPKVTADLFEATVNEARAAAGGPLPVPREVTVGLCARPAPLPRKVRKQ